MLDMRIGPIAVALAGALVASGASAQAPAAQPAGIPGLLQGYLSPESLPDSLALLPPPPAADTASIALDEDVARQRFVAARLRRVGAGELDAD